MNERDLASELMSLRDRVRRLRPLNHDPEAYFVERDDIQHALGKLAKRLCPNLARLRSNPRAPFTPGPIVVNGRIVGAFVRRAGENPTLRAPRSRQEREP